MTLIKDKNLENVMRELGGERQERMMRVKNPWNER